MAKDLDKIEAMTCHKLAKIAKQKYSLDHVLGAYERAYDRYRTMITTINRQYVSPSHIMDEVAYVNALARYAAALGVQLKEIR